MRDVIPEMPVLSPQCIPGKKLVMPPPPPPPRSNQRPLGSNLSPSEDQTGVR